MKNLLFVIILILPGILLTHCTDQKNRKEVTFFKCNGTSYPYNLAIDLNGSKKRPMGSISLQEAHFGDSPDFDYYISMINLTSIQGAHTRADGTIYKIFKINRLDGNARLDYIGHSGEVFESDIMECSIIKPII
tara:strand:+ start:56 stop:457 length:402 start_codon:yes stop_codon:yes gene_type:complete